MDVAEMKLAEKAYIIFCDDVREEVGNKLSLMGVYSKKIVFPSLPVVMRSFHIVVIFENLKKNFKRFNLVFNLPEAKPLEVSGTPPAPKDKNENMNLLLGYAALKIEKPGIASAKLFIDGEEKPEVQSEIEIITAMKDVKK